MNTNKIATGSVNKKLLAALAVLAVAFVVLAAVPAVATDSSDAAGPVYTEGVVAAGEHGSYQAQDIYNAFGFSVSDAVLSTGDYSGTKANDLASGYIMFYHAGDEAFDVSATLTGGSSTLTAEYSFPSTALSDDGLYLIYWSALDGSLKGFDGSTTYNVQLSIDDKAVGSSFSIAPKTTVLYQDIAASKQMSITESITILGSGHTITTTAGTGIMIKTKDSSTAPTAQNAEIVIKDLTLAYGKTGSNTSYGIQDDRTGNDKTAQDKWYSLELNGVTIKDFDSKGIYIADAKKLTVTGCTFENTAKTKYYTDTTNGWITGGDHALQVQGKVNKADIVIEDTKFTGNNGALSQIVVRGVTGAVQTSVTIKGCTFDDADVSMGNIVLGKAIGKKDTEAQITSGQDVGTLTIDAAQTTKVCFRGSDRAAGDTQVWNGNEVSQLTVSLANGAEIKSSYAGSKIGFELVKGDATIAGVQTIEPDKTLTVDDAATLTIGSGAVLKVTSTEATPLKASKNKIVNNGTIVALDKNAADGIKTNANVTAVVGYAITTGTSTNATVSAPKLAYAGESVQVTAAPNSGFKVDTVAAKVGNTDTNISAKYDAATGSYIFTMPENSVELTATTSGAMTATFVLVYDDKANETYYIQSGIGTSTNVVKPADPIREGYFFVNWYTDAAATKAVTSWGSITESTTYYGRMQTAYPITVEIVGKGTATVSPTSAVLEGSVTVTTTPESGWKLADNGVKVVAADGTSITYANGKFVMPAQAVTVSAEFKQLYTVSVPTTISNGTITIATSVTDRDSSATGTQVFAGDTITVTATPNSTYVLGGISLGTAKDTDAYGTLADGTVKATKTENNYTFKMPAADTLVTPTFGTGVVLTLSNVTNGTMTATAAGKTISAAESGTAATLTVAKNTEVSVTVKASSSIYALASLKINGGDDLRSDIVDGTYTFKIDSASTVSAEFGDAIKISKVNTIGSGTVKYGSLVGVTNDSIEFTVLADEGYKLSDVKAYTVSGSTRTEVTATDAVEFDEDAASVKLGSSDYEVDFTFTAIVYYNVTLDDVTDSGATLYSKYEKNVLSNAVTFIDGSAKVEGGTYYLLLERIDGWDIVNASAAHAKDKTYVDSNGKTQYDYHAGDAYAVEVKVLSKDQAIYEIAINDDAAITANYRTHVATVTFTSTYTNGTLAITADGAAVTSTQKVPYGTVLTFVATATTSGYISDGFTVNDKPYGDATYKVGMEDTIDVKASFAQGFNIRIDNGTGITATSSLGNGAKVGDEVTITYEVAKGYYQPKVTGTYGTAQSPLTLTPVSGQQAYTFEMPTGDVVITATADKDPNAVFAAEFVYVYIGTAGDNTLRVAIESADGGYIPDGEITLTFTYLRSNGYSGTRTITVDYTNDDTSKTFDSQNITVDGAVLTAISAGSSVAAYATFTIGDAAEGTNSVAAPLSGYFKE